MTHGFTRSDAEYPFDKYLSNCCTLGETRNKLDSTDIIILPTPYEHEKYYFAQEAVNFVKYCRYIDNNTTVDILADEDKIESRNLCSFDIWMPIIFIATNILLPIAVNLVSSYIDQRMKGREKEECTVKVSFIIKDGDKSKALNYDGDAKTFKEKFEKIDISKL